MGTTVNSILDRNQFTEEIEGIPFTLRRITAEMSLSIVGAKSLGIIRGAGAKSSVSPEDSFSLVADMMPKYLEAAMVEPKLGKFTDVETNTISLVDLGDLAVKVFNVTFQKSGYGKLENFPNSSEDTPAKS